MNELDKNIPDDFWRKTFDEAAETPSPRVWDAIERKLDESDGPKILPLWGSGRALSRPVGWGIGVAAALALLLVGWWAISTQSSTLPVAHQHQPNQRSNVSVSPDASGSLSVQPNTVAPGLPTDAVASANKPLPSAVSEQSTTSASIPKLSIDQGQSVAASGTKTHTQVTRQSSAQSVDGQPNESISHHITNHVLKAPELTGQSIPTPNQRPFSNVAEPKEPIAMSERMAAASYVADRPTDATTVALVPTEALVVNQLTGRPLHFRKLGPIQRIVWYQPADNMAHRPEMSKAQRKNKEKWASVSMMPGSFNPMVALRSTQAAYTNSTASLAGSSIQSTVTSKANFSVAYQAGAGVQLTDRWSVESGIGYLAGHATVESPAHAVAQSLVGVTADRNTVTSNLYVDALRSSFKTSGSNSAVQASSDMLVNNASYNTNKATYTDQTRQVLTNDFQYMQVPIQVGYQLRPRKRLSMAILGGFLTNIFVKNTVGSDVVVTAKDGVYRPVSLAATMGARFRYRPSGKWSASLAGLYQPSLSLGTQSESQVQSRPTSTGMSFGVDYHF